MSLNQAYIKNLTDKEFEKIQVYIYKYCGINLTPVKKTMVQSRLFKLLQKSQFASYGEYLDFALNSDQGKNELVELVDVITTNKTDFFREPAHFDFIKTELLPAFIKHNNIFNVWSAGCSTGAEAFTTAIVLNEFKRMHNNFNYEIMATDISTKVLQAAKQAIYKLEEVNVIPMELKKRYLLKSKNHDEKIVRFVPELRHKVKVGYLNLIDSKYEIKNKFDLIFCRNVLIYFDQKTRESILKKLCAQLNEGSILMLGHSESIFNMDLPLKQIQPSIFYKI